MYRKLFFVILILIGSFFLVNNEVKALELNEISNTVYILDDCKEIFDKEVLDFLQQIFSVMCYIGVGLCLVMSTFDFVKAAADTAKNDALVKAAKTAGKRLVYAVILFLIPFLINFVFEFILGWTGTCGIN